MVGIEPLRFTLPALVTDQASLATVGMAFEKALKKDAMFSSATGAERRLQIRDRELLNMVQKTFGNVDIENTKGDGGGASGMSQTVAITSVCNTLLGSGVLALASTVQEVGTLGFAFCMTVAAFAAYNTHVYLFRCCFATKTKSLEGLGRAAFQQWGAWFAAWGVILQGFGSLSSYTILIADLGSSLAGFCAGFMDGQEEEFAASDSLAFGSGLPNRAVIVWLVVGFMILPISLLPTLAALKRISQLGVAVFAIFVVVTATTCATATPRAGELRLVPADSSALLLNCPTLLFALNSHHTILTVFAELQPAPGKSLLLTAQEVSKAAYVAIWTIYMLVGILGYWAYRDSTRANLLMNMPQSALIVALRGMMMLSVVAGYPNIHFAVRRALMSSLLGAEHPAVSSNSFSVPQVAITLLIVGGVTTFALLLPGLKTAFALTGATSTSFLMLVFPAAVFLRVHRGTLKSADVLAAVGHITAGLLVGILCVGAQIQSGSTDHTGAPQVVRDASAAIAAAVPRSPQDAPLPMELIVH